MKSNPEMKKIAFGAGFLFLNGFIVYGIRFLYKLLVSRHLGPENYGLLSLGLMFVGIFGLLSALGTSEGVIKFIAKYHGLKDSQRVKGTINFVIKFSLTISGIIALLLIIFSNIISNNVFHNSAFRIILIIFALSLPLFTLIRLVGKIFTGFKKPEYSILSVTFGYELTLLILAFIAIWFFNLDVVGISLIYFIPLSIGILIGFILLQKKVFPIFSKKIVRKINHKELLTFSLPLFFSALFMKVMGWTDTFFLATLKDTVAVGIYNIALPLATTLGIFLTAFSSMFFPIMSEMKAKKQFAEMGNMFSTVARWTFLLSLPFFLFIIFFPEKIILHLFGEEYVTGYIALVLISSGYFVNVITGPAVELLKAFSKVKFIFKINTIIVILNIILNIILITFYGITGAALATAITFILRETIMLLKARKIIKFQYQTKYYFKYLASAFISSLIVFSLVKFFTINSFINILTLLVSFVVVYFTLVFLFRGITKEDKDLLNKLINKVGLEF